MESLIRGMATIEKKIWPKYFRAVKEDKKKFEAIVPIYSHNSNGKLIGFLIISKKKSDDPFYDKDISLIDQITKEVVYPIEHSEVLRKLQQTDKIKTEFTYFPFLPIAHGAGH